MSFNEDKHDKNKNLNGGKNKMRKGKVLKLKVFGICIMSAGTYSAMRAKSSKQAKEVRRLNNERANEVISNALCNLGNSEIDA